MKRLSEKLSVTCKKLIFGHVGACIIILCILPVLFYRAQFFPGL